MSERAQRWLLWILAVALVAGTAIALRFARGYRAAAGLAPVTPGLPPNVNFRLDGVRAEGRRENRRAWTLRADRVDTTRNHDRVDFSGRVAAMLFQEGKRRGTVTAPAATYTDINKSLSATGKTVVLVHSIRANVKDDLRIESEKVNWNVGARHVECPGSVRASLGDSIVQGNRLLVDLSTRELRLNHVNGEFSLDTDEDAKPTPFKELLP